MSPPFVNSPKVTPLGIKLRHLRVDLQITQLEMAVKMNINQALLSRIEVGKQAPPSTFLGLLMAIYPEVKEDEEAFQAAVNLARGEVKISLDGLLYEDAELATALGKRFRLLSDQAKQELRLILQMQPA